MAPAEAFSCPSSADNADGTHRARGWHIDCASNSRHRVQRCAPSRDRRGVLILVVLSLLILFVVIAVMFVIVATRARAVARASSEIGRTGDTPEEVVNSVMLDLTRGSLNPHSPFRTTSLLEDLYGQWSVVDPQFGPRVGSVRGVVTASNPSVTNPAGSGGMVDITATPQLTPRTLPFSLVKDGYSGCVLTFVSGPAKGLSARILDYWPAGTVQGVTEARFRLFLLRNEYGNDQLATVQPGSQFVINGRPFSGTGIGYNADTSGSQSLQNLGRVNAADAAGRPFALQPNPAFFVASNATYGPDPAGLGGANEDYDAPDFQNEFMAFYATPNPLASQQIKPSFHDPALLSYWRQNPANWTDPALRRQFMFRPNPFDHPGFPAINPLTGPWDVDNDGDGVPDSVWIDPGYPVQMTAQGRLYKPLAALLVLDLDGRLNVNAHGRPFGSPDDSPLPNKVTSVGLVLAGGAANVTLPRGSGYGAAEIRLERVLSTTAAAVMENRYGPDGRPGAPDINDAFSMLKLLGVPNDRDGVKTPFGFTSPFGTPPDLKGRMAIALDPHGQLAWDKTPDAAGFYWGRERVDNPYELDLSHFAARALPSPQANAPYDNPFSIGELERILRPNDIDSGTLPSRLVEVISGDLASPARHNELTTDSWDPPAPNMLAGPSMRTQLATATVPGRMASLVDLVDARLTAQGVRAPDQKALAIDALLSPDVRRGLRMNINRPFGNGEDNASGGQGPGNGIVDDAQFETSDTLTYPPGMGVSQPVPFDPSNGQDVNFDGSVNSTDRILSRQLLARHLYVLLMLCSNDDFRFPLSMIPGIPTQAPQWGQMVETLDDSQQQELKAKKLAQWAVNVVDFRDADNIMTAFEFDVNPFNGWQANGNPADVEPESAVVFGCEMPVALLTETLAFHDRRVKDTDHDDNTGTTRDHPTNPDQTLDQPFIPRGSAFVEILAIFNPLIQAQSNDLFVFQSAQWRLDLGKMAGNTPVWRLAISEFHTDHAMDNSRKKVSDIVSEHPDTVSLQPFVEGETPPRAPWNFSLLNQPVDTHEIKIERVVWFSGVAPTGADADRTFYAEVGRVRLAGFQYAVVGPGGNGAGDRANKRTLEGITVGSNENDDVAETQQIRLTGDLDRRAVTFTGTANDSQANIKEPIGIAIASPATVKSNAGAWGSGDRVGFSISEPLFSDAAHHYPKPNSANPVTELPEAYGDEVYTAQKFRDLPLDSQPGMPLAERGMLKNGTYTNVRTVFLQRLADPTIPHHPQVNPYITVDWMPIDLTVFNGEDRYPSGSQVKENQWDPDDPSPNSDTNPKIKFSTRERGKRSTAGQSNTDSNIWTPVSEEPIRGTGEPSGPVQNYFRHKLVHSLGYLNKSYGQPSAAPAGPAIPEYLAIWLGASARPFPWIRWANRPFNNALELMEVPASTPARLCLEFNYVVAGASPAATTSPYDTSPDQNPFKRQFNHLLNFFRSTPSQANAQAGGDFYRLFDFVHVPSPFVGTETMLDPNVFHAPDPSNPTASAGGAGTEGLHAPFNWVSNYRDPGKINLNTINSPAVWDALMGVRTGQPRIPFDEFWQNRRGGGLGGAGVTATTPVAGLPTIMASVYRSGAGGDMVPDVPDLPIPGVHHTLLRLRTGSSTGGQPLFADPSTDPHANTEFANANRNAAFRYRDLERLANLTTTRSNVYAIWITVGYFEVFPNGPKSYNPNGGVDVAHPDGYELGPELGSDTGEIERHRGFYVLDRSIPVGFERGFNHNVERAIVLKRFIE